MKKIYKLPAGAHIYPSTHNDQIDTIDLIMEGLNTTRDWYFNENMMEEGKRDYGSWGDIYEWEIRLTNDEYFQSFWALKTDFILVSDDENI